MIQTILRLILAMRSKSLILGLIALLDDDQKEYLIDELQQIRNGSNKELIIFIDDILNRI